MGRKKKYFLNELSGSVNYSSIIAKHMLRYIAYEYKNVLLHALYVIFVFYLTIVWRVMNTTTSNAQNKYHQRNENNNMQRSNVEEFLLLI